RLKELLAGPRIPQAQGAVPRGTCQQVAGMVKGKDKAALFVPRHLRDLSARGRLPKVDAAVGTAHCENVALRMPGHAVVDTRGLRPFVEELAGVQVAELNCAPAAAYGELSPC